MGAKTKILFSLAFPRFSRISKNRLNTSLRNRIYEQRWCFGRTLWLSWSKARRKHKKILWSSEHPVATGTQQKCDTISGRISCLAPASRAKNIENIEDTFHLYFDNDIMDKIIDCTNTKINETKEHFQQSDNFNESSKYT